MDKEKKRKSNKGSRWAMVMVGGVISHKKKAAAEGGGGGVWCRRMQNAECRGVSEYCAQLNPFAFRLFFNEFYST